MGKGEKGKQEQGKGGSTAAVENNAFISCIVGHVSTLFLISAAPLFHEQAIILSLFLVLALTSFSKETVVKQLNVLK